MMYYPNLNQSTDTCTYSFTGTEGYIDVTPTGYLLSDEELEAQRKWQKWLKKQNTPRSRRKVWDVFKERVVKLRAMKEKLPLRIPAVTSVTLVTRSKEQVGIRNWRKAVKI